MKNILSLVILLAIIKTFAQDQSIDFQRMVPPNPNVASLIKPVLTPVTEYAGIPNISIPIYTVQEDNVSFPISLSYHAGGIQVGEESGNVGLGWACNAGGIISRTIYGSDDLNNNNNVGNNSYLNTNRIMPDYNMDTSHIGTPYFNPLTNKFIRTNLDCELSVDGSLLNFSRTNYQLYERTDFRPDMFNFSFGAYSGSFILDRDGNVFLLEKSGIDIKMNPQSNVNPKPSFTIITEDGTEYIFKTYAITEYGYDTASQYISTWYLDEVNTINNRQILFDYQPIGPVYEKSVPIKTFVQYFDAPGMLTNQAGPTVTIDDFYLQKITFSNGEVNFNYSQEGVRQDIPFAHYIESIEVSNNQKIIKRHDFNYSYFGGGGDFIGTIENGDFGRFLFYNGSVNPHINLRLKLDSVVEDSVKEHIFDYYNLNNNQIPNKTSMSQDYWGFYNGIFNSNTFIPNINAGIFNVPNPALRYAVENSAKLFSIKRIAYPTKGYSEFDYESNTYVYGAESLDTNFWINGVPFENSDQPLTTVKKTDRAISLGSDNRVTKVIYPKTNTPVNVKLDFVIRGSAIEPDSNGQYRGGPFKFGLDIEVALTRNSDGFELVRQGYRSIEAEADFVQNGQAFQSVSLDLGALNDNEGYTLEAYFKDYNQTYFGQAVITATWQEIEASGTAENPLDFSVGGGLRVKSIIDFDEKSNPVRKRNFNYHYKETNYQGVVVEKSYGKAKTLATFALNNPLYIDASNGVGQVIGRLASSSSQNPLSKDMGSYIGYSQVEMTYENLEGEDNGKTVSKFYNFTDLLNRGNNLGLEYLDSYYAFTSIRIPHNGKLYEQQQFKRNADDSYTLLNLSKTEYRINGFEASSFTSTDFFTSSDFIMAGNINELSLLEPSAFYPTNSDPAARCKNVIFQFHPYYASRIELGNTTSIQYDENGQNPLVSTQNMFYDNDTHYMPTRTEKTDSEGNTINTQTWYPDDINNNPIEGGPFLDYTAIDAFKKDGGNPRIGQPIQTLTTNNDEKTLSRTNFSNWGNGIYQPTNQQTLKSELSSDNTFQDRILAYDYDIYGNPLEFSQDSGPITSYIWGYNKKYIIAKN